LVTELVREGYLRERRLSGYHRHVVRSLSLTEKGLALIQHLAPELAVQIRSHPMAPADGQGNWKKSLRLHRGAACLLLAMKMGAAWNPGKKKATALHQRLVYYSAYELNSLSGKDNKGARLSGVFFTNWTYHPVYYLGSSNMLWSEESEAMFRSQLEASPIGEGFTRGGDILVGEDWALVENLLRHAVNPRSRLIHFSPRQRFYYTIFDDNGLAQLRLLLDDRYRAMLQGLLYREQLCHDTGRLDYLFSLERVAEFHRPPNERYERFHPRDGYFFDFQMPVMQRLCNTGAILHPIPSHLLQLLDEEGGGDDGTA
jgi:hypothetical protein